MRTNWKILILSIVFANIAVAGDDTMTSCVDEVEGRYRGASERVISLYQTATIDRFDLDKYRTHLLQQRDKQLRYCAEQENQRLKVQLAIVNPRVPASSSQQPKITPAGFQEIESTYEFPDGK